MSYASAARKSEPPAVPRDVPEKSDAATGVSSQSVDSVSAALANTHVTAGAAGGLQVEERNQRNRHRDFNDWNSNPRDRRGRGRGSYNKNYNNRPRYGRDYEANNSGMEGQWRDHNASVTADRPKVKTDGDTAGST